jgi:tRNA(Ile)-lysidine synthase
LLHFTKHELKSYAQLHSIKWREDASNSKNDYLRNRLRNEIIPCLSSKIPTLNNSILCLQQIFQSQISDDDEMLEILKRKIQNEQKIDFEDLRRLNSIQTIELFKKLSVPIFVYKELNKLIEAQKGAKILWNNNQNCLIKEVNYLSLSINKKELNEMPQLIITITDSLPSTFNKSTYYFDAQNVKGKIQVRFWQKGDRLQPIGLNGSKLVSDILTDAKVANNERNEQFVLFDEEKILACHGHSIDKRALATKQSISIFRVELKIDKNSSYSRP